VGPGDTGSASTFLNNQGIIMPLKSVSRVFGNLSNKKDGARLRDVVDALRTSALVGSVVYDAASLVDGAGATGTVTVTGARLGDFAEVSFGLDMQGITCTAYVSAADTVSFRLQNESGGTIDLASTTVRALVRKAEAFSVGTAGPARYNLLP
jgi:hypothetical protein